MGPGRATEGQGLLSSRTATETNLELLRRACTAFEKCYLFIKIFIKNPSLSVILKIRSSLECLGGSVH